IYEYGVGGLMKLAGPVDPSTVEGMLSGAFKRAGVTATAGATSELSRILIDTAVMGNSSEFDLEVKRLRTEGMSAEEAWRQTFMDYVERVVDTGVRSGRYGLIAGLSEYGGEYFRQHPEAFNALVNGKTGWSGGMRGLQPGGAQGLLGLPGATLAPGGRMEGMPMLPGPAAVKDDWETAIEEAMAEQGVGDPEYVDISRENGIINGRGIEGTNSWFTLPDPSTEWERDGWRAGEGKSAKAGEHIKLYRVMSDAEYQSIINNGGKFSPYDRAMEEKWFAISSEDAVKWAEKFYPDGQYRMIEIEVPIDSLNQMYRVEKLDGIGPAYSGGIDFLNSIMKGLKLR
ncbi:MAG TPA: hypothetical protein VN421_14045, partial [Pseudoflavonifractor sp.]|nr:hypothetical protein [Pseudoflavonifractor sp.]